MSIIRRCPAHGGEPAAWIWWESLEQPGQGNAGSLPGPLPVPATRASFLLCCCSMGRVPGFAVARCPCL